MSRTRYMVVSPDGLPIAPKHFYLTRERAVEALAEWCQRFVAQGYYAGVSERIPLAELPGRCTIVEREDR